MLQRVRRALRRLLEWLLNRCHDGPQPPLHIAAGVVDFANHNPRATVEQWMRFAATFGQSQYRAGYARGATPQLTAPRHEVQRPVLVLPTSEELAMVVPRDPTEYISSIRDPLAQAHALDTLGRLGGSFRVVVRKP